jgi:hypothetical protein
VREGAFFGWPWHYLGTFEDPRRRGERPDLKDKITVPDVLIQAHSASMRIAFYNASQFPAEYQGDGFAAEHGSWNRTKRTGYKVIRVRLKDGVPTGEYEDFMTGLVVNDSSVWGARLASRSRMTAPCSSARMETAPSGGFRTAAGKSKNSAPGRYFAQQSTQGTVKLVHAEHVDRRSL